MPRQGARFMNDISSRSDDSLPWELARRMDEVCDHYEAAWRAGETPRVDEFLAGWEEPDRTALRQELLQLEDHYRCRTADEAATPPRSADTLVAAPGRSFGDYELREEVARGG